MHGLKTFFGWAGGLMLSFNAYSQRQHIDSLQVPAVDTLHVVTDSIYAPGKIDVEKPKTSTLLRFHQVHTDERHVFMHTTGDSISKATQWFLRDHRKNEVVKFNPRLFDVLADIKQELERRYPGKKIEFEVISAYRTSATNEALRKNNGGQAQKSHHILGEAMDIRVIGVNSRVIRDIATCLGYGGVGYYPDSNFVHVDVGRVRYWPSRAYLDTIKCP